GINQSYGIVLHIVVGTPPPRFLRQRIYCIPPPNHRVIIPCPIIVFRKLLLKFFSIVKILIFGIWHRTARYFQPERIIIILLGRRGSAAVGMEGNAGIAQVIAEVVVIIVIDSSVWHGFAFFGLYKADGRATVIILDAANIVGSGGYTAFHGYFSQLIACRIVGIGGRSRGNRNHQRQVQQVIGKAFVAARVGNVVSAQHIAVAVITVTGGANTNIGAAGAGIYYALQLVALCGTNGVAVGQLVDFRTRRIPVQCRYIALLIISNAVFLVVIAANAAHQAVQLIVCIGIAMVQGTRHAPVLV